MEFEGTIVALTGACPNISFTVGVRLVVTNGGTEFKGDAAPICRSAIASRCEGPRRLAARLLPTASSSKKMARMTRYSGCSLVFAVLGLWTAPASAQTVSDVLDFLVTGHSVQTGSFERDTTAAAATSLTVSRALLVNLATLPVPTSSGGFVYKFHPELGTVQRATSSFGPFFVERALAPGHGAASIGLTLQHWQFTALDGRNLRDGTLETTANQFVDELEPFDVDRLRLAIDATSRRCTAASAWATARRFRRRSRSSSSG